ncbi:unnamed protein product, partial [Adineta ricciae]
AYTGVTISMHSFLPHFFISCGFLFLVFGGLNSASINIGPNGIQLSGQNGNDQFINIAVPLNGFKIQISSDGGAVSSAVVNVPMIETPNYRVDASSAGIGTQEAGPARNVGRYPQMYSNLGFTADTSINRQVDPTFNAQAQVQNSPQTHLPTTTPANFARTFVPVTPVAVHQVESKIPNSNGCVSQVGPNGEKSISMANGNVNIVGQSMSCS